MKEALNGWLQLAFLLTWLTLPLWVLNLVNVAEYAEEKYKKWTCTRDGGVGVQMKRGDGSPVFKCVFPKGYTR